jgi:hypothetical protein
MMKYEELKFHNNYHRSMTDSSSLVKRLPLFLAANDAHCVFQSRSSLFSGSPKKDDLRLEETKPRDLHLRPSLQDSDTLVVASVTTTKNLR